MIEIKTPRSKTVKSGNNSLTLEMDRNFAKKRGAVFNRAQCFIDSEALRGGAKLAPMRTGMLIKSGTLGTVIGSGEVKYIAPHAKKQYYENRGRGIDKNRGRLWFERWKAAHKEETLRKAKFLTGAEKD